MARERRAAVVTGAGRGIGRAVALALAEDGYDVALFARTEKELEETERKITERHGGGQAFRRSVDISSAEAVNQAMSEAADRFGKLDILFNNAGMHAAGSWELSTEELERVIAVNLTGAFHLLRSAIPLMKRSSDGYVFNLASICGVHGFSGMGAYTASKFGLVGLNECLFRELVPEGIRVTALCPSWVNTQMAQHSPVPPEEMIQPDDIVKAVRFLLSLGRGAAIRELVIECRKDLT